MHFAICTLFPEYFDSPLATGLLGRALGDGVLTVERVNPRDFTEDNHRTVDDRPYGGGPGMVMLLAPVLKALDKVEQSGGRGRTILLTPRGRQMDQAMARELAAEKKITVICGRYEGLDARLGDLVDIEEVSVGDFVLSGGEAAACCLLEAVGRLLPGFMGHEESGDEESFAQGLLEYPHYTRPEVVTDEQGKELRVPDVLLSGDHKRIAEYRREQALATTWERRPELLSTAPLTQQDVETIRRHRAAAPKPARGRNLHLVLAHHPVLNKEGREVAVSLTNLDIHDIGRVSRCYGLGGFYLSTPLEDQRRLAATLLEHWTGGAGSVANPDRAEALSGVAVVESIEDALDRVRERSGRDPLVYVTSARIAPEKRSGGRRKKTDEPATVTIPQVAEALDEKPVVLLLGTGSGLTPSVVRAADAVVRPLRPFADYNHLSVRSATSMLVDRILGDTD